jgi:hypothetical protein
MMNILPQHAINNPLHAAARGYAARDWSVFPCHGIRDGRCTCGKSDCAHPGKHPLTRHGFKDATTDPQQIDQWWTDHPDANAAIATGAASGLIVLDQDPRHGGDLTLDDLQATYGKFPATVVSFTGGGGAHYFFQYFGEPIRSGTGVLGPGLDLKADDGYIIAPPSRHASGRDYEWEASSHPDEVPITAFPAWLWRLAKATTHDVVSEAQRHSPPRLGGKPVPLYVGTGSPTGEEISYLFKDPTVALACAKALGLPTAKIGRTFRCILHDDRHPSASLYWDPKTGALKYRDWHRKSGAEWYTLADVYASIIAGRVMRLPGPSLASWFLRLLVEAGICSPVEVPARPLVSAVRPAVRKVYEGFLLLLGCKWLLTPGAPTPFTWRFAADWCRLAERHAGESIQWLLREGYIRQVGTYQRMALFLPVPPH